MLHASLLATALLLTSACMERSSSPSSHPAPKTTPSAMPAHDGVRSVVEGVVVDRKDVGYVYVEVEDSAGARHWAVTVLSDVAVGDAVVVNSLGSREGFFSKRLERRFDRLHFAVINRADG